MTCEENAFSGWVPLANHKTHPNQTKTIGLIIWFMDLQKFCSDSCRYILFLRNFQTMIAQDKNMNRSASGSGTTRVLGQMVLVILVTLFSFGERRSARTNVLAAGVKGYFAGDCQDS